MYWNWILWHFRLYSSNIFFLSDFLYCKLGLDGYCSFVPYTIYERPVHGSIHLIISFTPRGIILWIVGKKHSVFTKHSFVMKICKIMKRESTNKMVLFFLHKSKHLWTKTSSQWSSPPMSTGKLGMEYTWEWQDTEKGEAIHLCHASPSQVDWGLRIAKVHIEPDCAWSRVQTVVFYIPFPISHFNWCPWGSFCTLLLQQKSSHNSPTLKQRETWKINGEGPQESWEGSLLLMRPLTHSLRDSRS